MNGSAHSAHARGNASSVRAEASPSSSSNLSPSVRSVLTRTPPATLLANLAPVLLQSTYLASPHFSSRSAPSTAVSSIGSGSRSLRAKLGWSNALPKGDARAMYIMEKVEELCRMEIPPAPFVMSHPTRSSSAPDAAFTAASNAIDPLAGVPLIRGFWATTPAAQTARLERRRKRAGVGEVALGLGGAAMGLRERGDLARGLLAGDVAGKGQSDSTGSTSGSKRRTTRRATNGRVNKGKVPDVDIPIEELVIEDKEVDDDLLNVAVRRAVINSEMAEVDAKIVSLDAIRCRLQRDLLGLRELELELEDEREGIRERITAQDERRKGRSVTMSSRRRKGPAFIPGEHDALPHGVAFMSLVGHLGPINSLDFSQPYGVCVTASQDESVRLWDLTTGDEVGFLRGHRGAVKALQVEHSTCITGGADGQIKIWDLDCVEATAPTPLVSPSNIDESFDQSLNNVLFGNQRVSGSAAGGGAGLVNGREGSENFAAHTAGEMDGMMKEGSGRTERNDGLIMTLDGHTKSVTSLYFEGNCLVTGSSDRTLRQFDLTTGQSVLTMDILWAITNPLASQTLSSDPSSDSIYSDTTSPYSPPRASPRKSLGSLRRSNSNFLPGKEGQFTATPNTTTYADGSFEIYDSFVGSCQFWNYALASGTGDGVVRLWDLRTGQAHRSLIGHTAPVTSVQFDEYHLVSGSLDKSIRIWDLRTGSIADTIRYDFPVTALQFDSRKIVAAAGEPGVRVFNRTTLQHSTLSVNGHTGACEKLRFQDRYLVSGGRDAVVKVWALA